MSRLITRIAKASARVASRITNELAFGTTIAMTASATTTSRTLIRALLIGSFPPEQPGRLHRQDQRHRRVQREVGNLREQRLAEIIGQADQQRADRCASQASHA